MKFVVLSVAQRVGSLVGSGGTSLVGSLVSSVADELGSLVGSGGTW